MDLPYRGGKEARTIFRLTEAGRRANVGLMPGAPGGEFSLLIHQIGGEKSFFGLKRKNPWLYIRGAIIGRGGKKGVFLRDGRLSHIKGKG